ncbi:hypothetical protein Nham_3738 [Nitrobacter hamburgensis X14]|uniref:Transmembrane protein n=1 Tax=Nitrobacter hamburgensis (strain DSM 10229 / NCIMB 13809 / X14) TaxID=323097 RepID=Q1QH35_NITHX|nr:hypothetical protein Nham_3738 [Nitrobacter hamburgensis X14]
MRDDRHDLPRIVQITLEPGTRRETGGCLKNGLKRPGNIIEVFQMLTRRNFKSSTGRSVVLATVAAMALAAAGPSFAGSSAPVSKEISATGPSGATDFSAARRHYDHRRHYRGGGDAAAAAAFAGIIGTVGAIAASQARRDAYYDYGPGYYAPPPGYYYGGPRYPSPYGGAYYAPY